MRFGTGPSKALFLMSRLVIGASGFEESNRYVPLVSLPFSSVTVIGFTGSPPSAQYADRQYGYNAFAQSGHEHS